MTNSSNTPFTVGMMRLMLGESGGPVLLNRAAEEIRQLDNVLRVRADAQHEELEIVFSRPAPDLLRRIHAALQTARLTAVAGSPR